MRLTHQAHDGQIFSWDTPPVTGNPGDEYGCRCWAEPTLKDVKYPDAIEPVYTVEELLLLLAGLRHLSLAWRTGRRIIDQLHKKRDTEWEFGKFKSETRWKNQMEKRGWTTKEITDAIEKGEEFSAPNDVNKENTATRYEYKGKYIVRDDQTKEILQIGGEDFIRPVIPGRKELIMSSNTVKVYVHLLGEGTVTARGTLAIHLGSGLYKLEATPNYDPEDEIWQFLPGSLVKCIHAKDHHGNDILLAIEQER